MEFSSASCVCTSAKRFSCRSISGGPYVSPVPSLSHIIGAVIVSLFLYGLYYFSSGKAIGGGDIKLMAYAGLLLGAKNIIFAFILACILGSVIHTIRMKVSKRNNLLALGPYLSAGIFIAALWGSRFWTWYLGMMGIY